MINYCNSTMHCLKNGYFLIGPKVNKFNNFLKIICFVSKNLFKSVVKSYISKQIGNCNFLLATHRFFAISRRLQQNYVNLSAKQARPIYYSDLCIISPKFCNKNPIGLIMAEWPARTPPTMMIFSSSTDHLNQYNIGLRNMRFFGKVLFAYPNRLCTFSN